MEITLVAMGMGGAGTLTVEAAVVLRRARAVIGAARLLAALPEGCAEERHALVAADDIGALLNEHPEWERVCVVFSGDVGFYSGAAALRQKLAGRDIKSVCGVSVVQYFAARLGRPWQDFCLASLHGRGCDVLSLALNHPAVLFLTDAAHGAAHICQTLLAAGLGGARVTVGENLGAPDERVAAGSAEEFAGRAFAPLHVALVENNRTFRRPFATQGIPDDAFLRGAAPMTKQEVRAVALAKLGVAPGDTVYDVGAGTGSVAVEMALQARHGRVYAIETDEEACGLLCANREKFGVYNLRVVHGAAPDAFAGLPAPDAAFIGGSGGRMAEILTALLAANPAVRLAVSAVALETLAEAMPLFETLGLQDTEVVQLAVSRGAALGKYTHLKALNPVFLASGRGAAHG